MKKQLNNIFQKAGDYAKSHAKSFLATGLIAGTMLASALSPQQTFAQTNGNNNNYNYGQRWLDYDTIWGNGILQTIDADNQYQTIGYATVKLTPDTMQMVTPDTTYTYMTTDEGFCVFEVPVGIDIYEGTPEYNFTSTITIFPTPGAGFNYNTTTNNEGTITIYNTNGQKIKTTNINGQHTFVDLNDQPNGLYMYTIKTQKEITSGKYVKVNAPVRESTVVPAVTPVMPTVPSNVMPTVVEARLNDRVGQASPKRQVDAQETPRLHCVALGVTNNPTTPKGQMTAQPNYSKANDNDRREQITSDEGGQMTGEAQITPKGQMTAKPLLLCCLLLIVTGGI